MGIGICIYLLYSTTLFDKLAGTVILLLGILLYLYFSPKQDIHHLRKLFLSEEAVFMRNMEKKERLLANFIGLLRELKKALKK